MVERRRGLRHPVGWSARARCAARGVVPAGLQRRLLGRLTGQEPGKPSPRHADGVILVTGCSTGFGLQIAVELARRGRRVAATMRDLDRRGRLDAVLADAEVADRVEVLAMDVTDPGSVYDVFQQVDRWEAVAGERGRLIGVVNNAGIRVAGPFEETPMSAIRHQFDVNLAGPMNVTRAALPGLRATDDTLGGLREVSDALASRRAALSRLVSDLASVAQAVGNDDKRLTALARDAAETLNALESKNVEFNDALATLPDFMRSLRTSTNKITRLSTELKPTLESVRGASDRLPTALEGLQDTLTQLADLSTEAGPLVREARPLVADLRPLVAAGNQSLVAITPFTGRLDSITQRLISSLDYRKDGELGYLQDFLANTTSVGSLSDGNGGIFRAEFVQNFGSFIPTTAKGGNR